MAERLLMILPYVPYPLRRGTYQRVFHLAEQLGQAFAVDLFCLSSEPEDRDHQPVFEAFCRRVHFASFRHPQWPRLFPDRLLNPLPTTVTHWWSPQVRAELRDFTEGQTYGRIHFCDLVLWPYVRALFPDHPCRIMDRSRVDWLYQREELRTLELGLKERLLRQENLAKIAGLEREVYRAVTSEIVCGWDDETFLRQKLGDANKVFVLPNGYNERFFDATAWPRRPTTEPSALFCGALDYTPNVDGLRWYVAEIHEAVRDAVPNFTLRIVGKSPSPEVEGLAENDGVELVGEVPDVRPYYQRAWLQIVPLRIGGGTRLKIVESLGMQCPVVSTTLGAQGLNLAHESDLLLADRPSDFAAAVVCLLTDAAKRHALEKHGLATVREHYTWAGLATALIAHYHHLSPRS